jgi:outer membrane receptor protein involved in Fe transport
MDKWAVDMPPYWYADMPDLPTCEYQTALFLIDRQKVTDRFDIEAQVRGEWDSGTGVDWAGRLSGMYALDDAKHHVLRLSGAKAFRVPNAMLREGEVRAYPLPPPYPPYVYTIDNTGGIRNEETTSVELGYNGQLTKWLTVRADTYYQWMTGLVGFERLPTSPPLPMAWLEIDNSNDARAYGAEAEVEVKGKNWKLSGWYAFSNITYDQDPFLHNVRAYNPAAHKVGLTGRIMLPDDWTLNAMYRYTASTCGEASSASGALQSDTGRSHRLDLTATKRFGKEGPELTVGVANLLERNVERVDWAGGVAGHDTPGRTFFIRLMHRF